MQSKPPHVGSIDLHSGILFDMFDPKPDDILITDIAHSLSNICRYTGHTKKFLSVAQHSVMVSLLLPPELKLLGLLHDATEAYLTDLAAPVKHMDEMQPYREMEHNLELIIKERFYLPAMNEDVHRADKTVMVTEMRDLMTYTAQPEVLGYICNHYNVKPLKCSIRPLPPAAAKAMFLLRYDALTGDNLCQDLKITSLKSRIRARKEMIYLRRKEVGN